jgi:hypothetical protein
MEWLLVLVVVGGLAAIAQFVLPVLFVVGAVKQLQQLQRTIAAQQALLAQGTGAFADPAAQDQFIAMLRQAGSATASLNGIQAMQAQQQLAAVLAQLGQTQPVGRWSNGTYFEQGNVVIPGGPSLINGQLFIPR